MASTSQILGFQLSSDCIIRQQWVDHIFLEYYEGYALRILQGQINCPKWLFEHPSQNMPASMGAMARREGVRCICGGRHACMGPCRMCGGAGCVSGWVLLHGVSLRCVIGDHMDLDVDVDMDMDVDVDMNVDMDACAVRCVHRVRAHWVCIGGAGNMVVGPECVCWGHSEHTGGRMVQTCWGGLRHACQGQGSSVRYGMLTARP